MDRPGSEFQVLDEKHLCRHGGVCDDNHPGAAEVQGEDVPISLCHLCVGLMEMKRPRALTDGSLYRTGVCMSSMQLLNFLSREKVWTQKVRERHQFGYRLKAFSSFSRS